MIYLHRLLRYVMPHDAISRLAGGVHKRHQDQVGTRLFQAGHLLRYLRRNGGATAVIQTLQSVNQRSIDVPFACSADHPARPPQWQGRDELGILLVDQLNAISIAGYELGFWFAQQGSIYTFVVLIFFYATQMNKLDRKFDVHED